MQELAEGEIFLNEKVWVRASHLSKAKGEYSNIDPQIVKRKGEIGTQVHHIIESDLKGEYAFCPDECKGYVRSFERWYERWDPKYIQMEERYFCDQMSLTGQIDAIIDLQGEILILDYKTSVKESPSWIFQAHYYHYLAKKTGTVLSDSVLFMRLDKNGNDPQVFKYKYDEYIHKQCVKRCLDHWTSKVTKSGSHK